MLVRPFGADLEGPRPHLVLEHLEGPRLSTLIRRDGRLELEQLLPLGLQLAAALHYLAEETIVHVDVKPSNIIMGAPARLIDLSIARSVEQLRERTRPIGTSRYMAPEQCDPSELGPITPAADVWGLAATLHHATGARPPFAAPSPADNITRGQFPQLHPEAEPLPSGVPAPLAALIAACLDPEPARRPLPAEVAAALEPLVGDLPRRQVLSRFRVRAR